MFLLTSKLCPPRGCQPLSRDYSIYIYKIMNKKLYKNCLQRFFLKLVANHRSDKRFLLTIKFCPLNLRRTKHTIISCTGSFDVFISFILFLTPMVNMILESDIYRVFSVVHVSLLNNTALIFYLEPDLDKPGNVLPYFHRCTFDVKRTDKTSS